ncbi:MAG: hypothetical protein JNM89_09560 [Hyphomicrobiaceae bacterium]|nr:hypothetical protein [Hyphomicrobiaceae bacterium]
MQQILQLLTAIATLLFSVISAAAGGAMPSGIPSNDGISATVATEVGLPKCECRNLDAILYRVKEAARMEAAFLHVHDVIARCRVQGDCRHASPGNLEDFYQTFYLKNLGQFVLQTPISKMGIPASIDPSAPNAVADLFYDQRLANSPTPPAATAQASGGTPTRAKTQLALTYEPYGLQLEARSTWVVDGAPHGHVPDGSIPNDYKKSDPQGYLRDSGLEGDVARRATAYQSWEDRAKREKGPRLCDWRDEKQRLLKHAADLKRNGLCEEFLDHQYRHELKHKGQCERRLYWGFTNSIAEERALDEAESYGEEAELMRKLALEILANEVEYSVRGSAILDASPFMQNRHRYDQPLVKSQKVELRKEGENSFEHRVVIPFKSKLDFTVERVHNYDGGVCTPVNPPSKVDHAGEFALTLAGDDVLLGGFMGGDRTTYQAACRLPHGLSREFTVEIPSPFPSLSENPPFNVEGVPIPFGQDPSSSGSGASFLYELIAKCKAR